MLIDIVILHVKLIWVKGWGVKIRMKNNDGIPENEKKDKKDVTMVTKIVIFDLKVTFALCILFKHSPSTDLKAVIFIHNKDI